MLRITWHMTSNDVIFVLLKNGDFYVKRRRLSMRNQTLFEVVGMGWMCRLGMEFYSRVSVRAGWDWVYTYTRVRFCVVLGVTSDALMAADRNTRHDDYPGVLQFQCGVWLRRPYDPSSTASGLVWHWFDRITMDHVVLQRSLMSSSLQRRPLRVVGGWLRRASGISPRSKIFPLVHLGCLRSRRATRVVHTWIIIKNRIVYQGL